MVTNAEIISMLKEDMAGEHGALILYLKHAYFIGESGEACEIEVTARDEMRHFKWLAQAIVQLGGELSLDREEMDLGGDRPVQWMQRDVRAEEDAIARYELHVAAIDDERIKVLIGNILTDERAHRAKFAGFGAKFAVSQEPAATATVPANGLPPPIAAMFDYGSRHEYTVALQYLLHSFMTPSYEASRELESVAINEMQHLGWFSELAAELGHNPLLEHDPVDASPDTPAMVRADLDAEEAVTKAYTGQLASLESQPEHAELAEVIERARANELYHIYVFNQMLGRMGAGKDPLQRPGIARTQPGQEPASVAPSARPETAPRGFTVGSLVP